MYADFQLFILCPLPILDEAHLVTASLTIYQGLPGEHWKLAGISLI